MSLQSHSLPCSAKRTAGKYFNNSEYVHIYRAQTSGDKSKILQGLTKCTLFACSVLYVIFRPVLACPHIWHVAKLPKATIIFVTSVRPRAKTWLSLYEL